MRKINHKDDGEEMASRFLGLDYGDARIGVAVCDPLGWTAQGLVVISRKNPINLSESIREIVRIVQEYQVGVIVIGLPKNMDNSEGESCKKVRAFKKKLEKALPSVSVELYDERLTTARAKQIFAEVDLAKAKHKKNVDKMAAALILQDYLETRDR